MGWFRLGSLIVGSFVALTAAGTSMAAPHASSISPDKYAEVASGVAFIRTYTCGGRGIGQGSGFLVGESVLMTARHVLENACEVRVTVGGKRFRGTRWVYWASGRSKGVQEDVATLKLDRPALASYVFTFRTSIPPPGANLAMIGHPLGNRVSMTQGPVIWRGKVRGVPQLAVRMLGAEGASGSPFVDDRGRVVGILQLGTGSKDVLGQRTSGVVVGIDLSRWWGAGAKRDLCRAYPRGRVPGCKRQQPPPELPPPPQPPARPPVGLQISDCWISTNDAFDPAAKAYTLSPTKQDVWVNARYNRPATEADSATLQYQLFRPDGTIYGEGMHDAFVGFSGQLARFSVVGSGNLAPMGGNWTAAVRLTGGAPCTFAFEMQRLHSPLEVTATPTQFDPNSTFGINLNWTLRQELAANSTLSVRLVTPSGTVSLERTVFTSSFATAGAIYLPLPYCSRFWTSDSCSYGTYRVEVVRDGNVVGEIPLTGIKPA